jgi:protein-S-isoprenylcysteine O-methyltransferase Ste14
MIKRLLIFLFGLVSYVTFLFTVLYGIGFVGNIYFEKTIDSGSNTNSSVSLVIDLVLIALFGFQHSLMARQGLKKQLTRLVPEPAERSIFVFSVSLCLLLLFWQWRPIQGHLWILPGNLIYILLMTLYGMGWLIVILSTFLINHFDFVGLRQVYLYLTGRKYTPLEFKQHLLYKIVRHPLILGLLISFWATPRMSIGHLIFATGMTIYSLIGLAFEERDLLKSFGNTYQEYRKQVPMLIPMPRIKRDTANDNGAETASIARK